MLLLAAAQQTGLLEALVEAVMALADPTIPGLSPSHPAVLARLLLTLLFLPVAGLARTWDLRSYTGTMLAVLTGRERAYSQRYTERFLARLAHAGAAEGLTAVVARWTWSLWQTEQPSAEQPDAPAVFYVDGLSLAVYSDVLVPRGPVGKLGGKILGCRELVVLHDADGHPLLATTHRGDHHLTRGLPQMLHCYEQATDQALMQRVVVDREGMAADFLRWKCQENSIRDWLIPLNLDTNHGYAKEPVVNSELAKRQLVVEGRHHRLEHLAQACRARLAQLAEQDHRLEEQAQAYEQRRDELVVQVIQLEAAGQTEEREYFPVKARQLATDWEMRQRKAKLEKHAVRRQRLLDKCEGYCRELRQVLRRQEDLEAQARQMYELDHAKDQIMTLFKLGLANLGMWVRDEYFGESYQHCGWQRLLPFFKLGGWITATTNEVQLEVCAFNNQALVRDLEEVCRKVNSSSATLPDGRRLVVAVGKRLRSRALNGPLALTG